MSITKINESLLTKEDVLNKFIYDDDIQKVICIGLDYNSEVHNGHSTMSISELCFLHKALGCLIDDEIRGE